MGLKDQPNPIPLKVIEGEEAWMYVFPKKIEVCVYKKGVGTLVAKITKKQLEKISN